KLTPTEKAEFMKRSATATEDPVAKALAEVTKSSAALTAEVAELRADAERRKVRDELADLADHLNVVDLADTVIKLRKADKGAADEMLKTLRASIAQGKQAGLFTVIGKGGVPSKDEAAVQSKVDAAVAKVRAAQPTLTKEQAEAQVWKADPTLYTEYLAAKEA